MEIKILILVIVAIVLFFIAKNYKHEDYLNIQIDTKQKLQGNLEDHEAGLLVALMAKVAKADGKICELEAELLGHTFTDLSLHFENSVEIREKLKAIYNKEKESFDNTIVLAQKYLRLTKSDYNKRVKFLEYILNLAFADGDFGQNEFMITEDIANAIEIKKSDFEKLIGNFKSFYAQKANDKINSVTKAYEILESNQNDSFDTIKQNYRKLVKKHHPDVVQASGADSSIIEMATRRLQEINEAYEIIKKEKNVG